MRCAVLLVAALACMGAAAPARLSPDGYGPAKVGMTHGQVERALGVTLEDAEVFTEGCLESGPAGNRPGVMFMFEDGRLTRVTTTDDASVRTAGGLHVGSSVAEVRKAYGKSLVREPAPYADAPAHDLFAWRSPRRGLRFEIDEKGRVAAIHAGSESIRYIEGCL